MVVASCRYVYLAAFGSCARTQVAGLLGCVVLITCALYPPQVLLISIKPSQTNQNGERSCETRLADHLPGHTIHPERRRTGLRNIQSVPPYSRESCANAPSITVTYVYYNMAASAHALVEAIDTLDPENDGVQILQHTLVPVLKHLDGTPVRAIVTFVAVSRPLSFEVQVSHDIGALVHHFNCLSLFCGPRCSPFAPRP